MLDCKNTACQTVYAKPAIQSLLSEDFTSPACQAHFATLSHILDALGIPWQRNFSLVRGLDYYTKTVFEITTTHLGAQNAVCGGGRYDHLVEELGGPATPAVGWALGMERLMSLLPEASIQGPDFFIVSDRHAEAFQLADSLRTNGWRVEVDLSGQGFGKQLERAARLNAHRALILGETEAAAQSVQVRDLQSAERTTQTIAQADLLTWPVG